jgi:regulator of nonsense transcripts 3
MPGGRRRNDNRQGTIDQDPDFKDFLESLTNPITKPAAPDDSQKQEKIRTTPLIEALREKKANRDKPNTKANRIARGDGKDDAVDKKVAGKAGKENAPVTGDKNRRAGKADKTQAARDAVKILNKEASTSKDIAAAGNKTAATSAPERKRGNVAGVKSLLQRDLGIAAAPTRRRGTKREVASATSEAVPQKDTTTPAQKRKDSPPETAAGPSDKSSPPTKKERPTRAERRAFKASVTDKPTEKPDAAKMQTPAKTATASAPQILKKPQPAQAAAPPKGPAASRPTPTEPAAARATPPPPRQTTAAKPTPPVAPVQRSTPPPPVPAPTSKQGFLKHANPSQGITEPLIEETLKAFGAIERVEIDKRKGFAYVDFVEPEGLQKAMAASPIKIAQGAVQVLERKEKAARPVNPRFNGPPPTGPARGGRGGFAPRGRGALRGGAVVGRGGAHVVASPAGSAPGSPAPTPAAPASVSPAPTPAASVDVAT